MPRHFVLDALGRFLHLKSSRRLLSDGDREFLKRFEEIIKEHQGDSDFTTKAAATGLGMSRMHLNRKVQALTGRPTHRYILERRLEVARELLPGGLPVRVIARLVGFKSTHHFVHAFQNYFGVRPSSCPAREALARQPTWRKPRGK